MNKLAQMIAEMREENNHEGLSYNDGKDLLDALEMAVEVASEHKWHEDHCTYRIKFHLNNENLCDCGAFKAKAFLQSLEAIAEKRMK